MFYKYIRAIKLNIFIQLKPVHFYLLFSLSNQHINTILLLLAKNFDQFHYRFIISLNKKVRNHNFFIHNFS